MFVNLWVTTKCNLNCSYCYEGVDKKQLFISKETIDNVILHIENYFTHNDDNEIIIEFHGGEPLLNYDAITYCVNEIKRTFSKKRFLFGITTNATLLTEAQAQFLAENMTYNLSVSIDGSKETHDKCRVFHDGKGTFDIVRDKCELLLQKAQGARARMTVIPSEVGMVYENCMTLVDIGFRNIQTEIDYFNKEWKESDFDVLFEQVNKLAQYSLKAERNIKFSLLNYIMKTKGLCNFGESYFNVNVNGDIYPCTFCVGDKKFILGNINDGGFTNKKIIQEIQNVNKENNPACSGCLQVKYCPTTRCKLVNKALTGCYIVPSATVCAMQNLKFAIAQMYSAEQR